MMTPKDPVGGLVAHFDLASAAPGRDLADGFSGLKAEGRLKFTPWGVAFGEGGSLSSADYSGPTLQRYSMCVWVRHDGVKRSASGSPLWLEAAHTPADDESRRKAQRAGTPQPPWGEGLEFTSARSGAPTVGVSDHIKAGGRARQDVAPDASAWGEFQLFVANFDGGRTRSLGAPTPTRGDLSGVDPIRHFEAGKTRLWIGPFGERAGSGDLTGLTVAEVRIYDRELNAAEVATLRASFARRRVQRGVTVARTLPRFVSLHTLLDDGTYSEAVWVGPHQHVRVDPLTDGQVSLSAIEWGFTTYAFKRLGVTNGQVAPAAESSDPVTDAERWHVVQAPSGKLVFVSHDWKHTLDTTHATGGSESKLNLSLSDFSLYEWPELQTWGTSTGVRAGLDLMGPGSQTMLPVGWFRDVRQQVRKLQPTGAGPWERDAGGLVSGAYTRPLPDIELPRGGFTLLAWARLEPGSTVASQGVSPSVVQVMLGRMGAFYVTLNLTRRREGADRVPAFGLFHDGLPSGLVPTTPLNHKMQLVSLWVDVDKKLMGIRVGATTADSVIALPDAMATALSTTDETGGRLDVAARAGEWTLAGVELHAGRLSDSDIVVRDIVFRQRAASKLDLGPKRLPTSFTLYAPAARRYLTLSNATGATSLATTTDRSKATTWVRQDQSYSVVRMKHADSDTWLTVGRYDDTQHGHPNVSNQATMFTNLRVLMLPNGHLAFEDLRNVWMRATDSEAEAVEGRELFFPPPLGSEHAWVAKASPLLAAVQAVPGTTDIPPAFAMFNAREGGYLSTRTYFDLSDDQDHPLHDPVPTFWHIDRTPIAAGQPPQLVYLREPSTGKWLGASGRLWATADAHTDVEPVIFVPLGDGQFAFQGNRSPYLFLSADLSAPAVGPRDAVTAAHKWTLKVAQ